MQNYTLSHEQMQAISSVHSEQLLSLSYLDKHNLCDTVIHSAIDDAINQKRSLIIVDSEELMHSFKEKINLYNLGSLTLCLEENDFLDELSLAKIRSQTKNRDDVIPKFEKLSTNPNHDKILNGFRVLTAKIFGDRNITHLERIISQSDHQLISWHKKLKLEFTPQEFWNLRGKIKEAQEMYHDRIQINDSVLKKFNLTIDQETSLDELRNKLVHFKTQLGIVINQLEKEIIAYENRIWEKLDEEYLQIDKILNEIITSSCNKDELAPRNSISFLTKKAKPVYLEMWQNHFSSIKESILLEDLPEELFNLEKREDILSLCNKLLEQNKSWKKTGSLITRKVLRTLNKNNGDSENFKNIDVEINKLFSQINESEIFVIELENNSMNTMKLYQFIQSLLSDINVLLSYLKENPDILFWESFFSQQTKNCQEILDLLQHKEVDEWVDIFEAWYLRELVKYENHPDSERLGDLLSLQQSLNNTFYKNIPDRINYAFAEAKEKAFNICKNRNKKMFQEIYKKKGIDHLRMTDIIWNEKDMLTQYFPIIIISSKLIRSNRLLKDGKWDQIYCEGTDLFNHVEKYTLLEQKICFYQKLQQSLLTAADLGFSADDPSKNIKLLIHEYNYAQPLKEIALTDRLRAAKKMAKILLSLNTSVKVFQLRDANIISFLNEYDAIHFTQQLDDSGIKEIEIEDNIYEVVTESILAADRKQYLIYYDHLINSEQYTTYAWQLEVLDQISKAGFTCIHVNSRELVKNNQYLDNKIDQFFTRSTANKDLPAIAEA